MDGMLNECGMMMVQGFGGSGFGDIDMVKLIGLGWIC
jgi:hypothetical protein